MFKFGNHAPPPPHLDMPKMDMPIYVNMTIILIDKTTTVH